MTLTPEREIASECLAVRLRMLSRLVTNVYEDALRPFGVRVSQMNILVAIAAMGPVQGVDLANRLGLDPSTLSRDLERMLAHGWVSATAGRGRARKLEATDAGRELLAGILPAWRLAQEQARRLLTPALAHEISGRVNSMWTGQGA